MMGIASEIREAIVKRGGTPPSHGGIAASLDVLNKLNSGGGGSGGGGDFVVNFDMTDENNIVPDKTVDEIFSAFKSGKNVNGLGFFDDGNYKYYYKYHLTNILFKDNDININFTNTRVDPDNDVWIETLVYVDNKEFPELSGVYSYFFKSSGS